MISIDTLKFRLDDYEILKSSKLIIQPSTYNHGTNEMLGNFLLYQDKNHNIEGAKAFYNSDDFNLTLSVKKGSGAMCFVQMSLPKYYHGNNFHSVDKLCSKAVLKKIENNLLEVGVSTNIFNSYLSRLDTFKNIQTDEKFNSYSEIFSELEISRKKKRDYGGTTFLYSNDSEEICIYNKILEMQSKNISTKDLPENVMRFENRLLTARKIKATLSGMSKVVDLFDKDNYEFIQQKFICNMEKSIFKYSSAEIIINSVKQIEKIEQELSFFMMKYPSNWFDKYLRARGVTTINNEYGKKALREALKNLLSDINENTRKVKLRRLNNLILEVETDLLMVGNSRVENKTVLHLYDELKRKVLAA